MRKITDMLVLYVLCAVLESACGITNHVVVSLLLLFIEVCAVIYLQSMAGRTFAVTVYLLSFLVIKETSYGFPVVLYAVWEQVLGAAVLAYWRAIALLPAPECATAET